MSGLLLGADAIEDLIAGDPLIVDWLTSRENQPTSASFSTIAFLLAQAHETEDVAQRELWLEEVRRFPHGPNIQMYGFDLEAAEKWAVNWANLSADKTINAKADVDFGELQLIAICLAQSLDYVAPRRPWHAKVAHLKQHDPWQGQSYGA